MKNPALLLLFTGIAMVCAACSQTSTAPETSPTSVRAVSSSPTTTPSPATSTASAVSAVPQPTVSAHTSIKPSAASSKPTGDATNSSSPDTVSVELDHIRFHVNKEWKVQKGADSVSFLAGGKTIAVVDGLAYSDSVESLVPSRVDITEQRELKDLPFPATKVITDVEGKNGTKMTHIYLFLKKDSVVYDFHADSDTTKEETLLTIAKTAQLLK